MRILVITNMYPSERAPWAGVFVKEFVEQLRRHHKVDVASIEGVKKDLISKVWKASLLTAKTVSKILERYDIVHAHYLFPPGFLALLHQLKSTPVVVHCHGSDLYIRARGPLRRAVGFVLRRADFVLCVSGELRDIAIEMGAEASKTSVLPMGVDVERIFPRDKMASRKEIGLPEEGTIITQVGALIERKRPLLSLKVFSDLLREGMDLYLVYGGTGPLYTSLKEKATEMGVGKRVFLLGSFPEYVKPILYGASDVILLPSSQEAYGLVAAEALAAGRPVVASNVGGLRDIVDHGINGFLFDSEKEFKEYVAILARNSELRMEMGMRGRSKAVEKLSWEVVMERLLRIYEKIIDN